MRKKRSNEIHDSTRGKKKEKTNYKYFTATMIWQTDNISDNVQWLMNETKTIKL